MAKFPPNLYLPKGSNNWWFQKQIREEYRHLFGGFDGYDGRRYVRKSLGTSDLVKAKAAKERILDRIEAVILRGDQQSVYDTYNEALRQALFPTIDLLPNPASPEQPHVHNHAEAALDALLEQADDKIGLPLLAALPEGLRESTLTANGIDPVTFFALLEGIKGRTRPKAFTYTLKSALDDYVKIQLEAGYEDSPRTSVGKTRRAVAHWLEDQSLKDQPLADIRSPDVAQWVRALARQGLAAGTIRDRLINLAQVWHEAQQMGKVDEDRKNPFRDHQIKVGRKKARVKRKPMPDDVAKSTLALLSDHDRFPFLLSWYSGCRMGEVFLLRPEDISDEHEILTVTFANLDDEGRPTGKTVNATRVVPVHSAIDEMVRQVKNGDRPLSAKRRREGPKSPVDAYADFIRKRIRKVTEDPLITFHSIRGRVNTLLRRQYPTDDVKLLMGHATTDVNTVYYYDGPTLQKYKEMIESLPTLELPPLP